MNKDRWQNLPKMKTQPPEGLGPEGKPSGVNLVAKPTNIDVESQQKVAEEPHREGNQQEAEKIRVYCFVDGFNLYHAIEWFENGVDDADHRRYRKYKWLSLTALANCYISSKSQSLVGVEYFTTYPHWDPPKVLRHRQFVLAQQSEGVKVTFGNYKEKRVDCRATCKLKFTIWQEKQTDVNIAVRLIELARRNVYDKAIIISGDSDLIPAIKLVREIYAEKYVAAVVPIGRRGEDIEKHCHGKFKMTEEQLARCHLPDKLKHPSGVWVTKPYVYV
ncbi:MAG TPA: NYN domain-containing protein [Candidatus Angelobacter sp.]|jgi:uncharacterized LabA/DUF88 family protein|nr:NYN domain-containing protein [Candidatus Angelobacter sp.]